MNKVMLASLTAILAGAMTMPAFADDNDRRARGERSEQAADNKGPHREAPQADRGNRGEDRGARADNRQRVRDRLPENREPVRQAPRAVVRAPVAEAPRAATRYPQSQARDAWQAQMRDRDRDGSRDRDRDGNRDRDRDYRRDDRRDDRYSSRNGDRDWRNEWRNDRHDWRNDQRRDGRYYTRYRDSRWSGFQWSSQYRYRAPVRYVYPTNYRPYRWSVGYRMPYQYYSPRGYWIDYRAYRLPPPPYGYQWIRVDRDVVLVELASGLIRDVLFGLFF